MLHNITMSLSACCSSYIEHPRSQIYTLSLHDALPISLREDPKPIHSGKAMVVSVDVSTGTSRGVVSISPLDQTIFPQLSAFRDRKSTRLNSSHVAISYAVFCLKKKINSNTSTCKVEQI